MTRTTKTLAATLLAISSFGLSACSSNSDVLTTPGDIVDTARNEALCLAGESFAASVDAYAATQELAPGALDTAALEALRSELPASILADVTSPGEIILSAMAPEMGSGSVIIALADEVGGSSTIPGC